MTKATAKKPANKKVVSTKQTTKKPASDKPTATFTGEVLIGLTFPLICNSIKDLNTLELCALGFIATATEGAVSNPPSLYTVEYIHRIISTRGGKDTRFDEVAEALDKLNRRRIVKKNPMKNPDGSPDKFYTLSTRGQTLVNTMQCELWNVIRCNEMKL